jgi:beta-xylosidase
MKRLLFPVIILLISLTTFAQHNPIIPGWYADPEGIKYGNTYWVFPTYSAKYGEQVFMDAYSSTDLKTWEKHPHVLDTANVKWTKRAVWAPAVLQKGGTMYTRAR